MLFRRPFWFRLLRTRFRRNNLAVFPHHGPIWGQQACGDLPLGRCTMAKNGCEIIAVYNALRFLGREVPLTTLIRRYQQEGWIMAWGHLGSDPYAAGDYLIADGIPHRSFTDFDSFARGLEEGKVFILSFWVNDRLFSGVHGVTLYRSENDLWVSNLYNNQQSPRKIESLRDITTPRGFIVGYEVQ